MKIVSAVVVVITTARVGHAADPSVSAPLVVFFDASASDLPQAEIRAALARELERPVRPDSDPEAATLFIHRDAERNLVVRYRAGAGELADRLPVASAGDDSARRIALIAQKLVTGASAVDPARVPTAESGASGATHHAAKSAPVERRTSLDLRLAGALGFGNATYESRAASGMGGLDLSITGPVAALYAGLGLRTISGVTIGAELGTVGNGFLANHGGPVGQKLGPFALRIQLGPFIDYAPTASGRLRVQAGVAVARYFFQYAVAACDTRCGANSDALDEGRIGASLWGGTGYLGIAHDVSAEPGRAGVFVRTSLGYFAADRTSMWPLELSVGGTLAWF